MNAHLVIAVLAVLLVLAAVALVALYRRISDYRRRYAPIVNMDEAVQRAQRDLERIVAESQNASAEDAGGTGTAVRFLQIDL